MYPYKIFGILTLYDILLSVGIVLGIMVFGYLADKQKIKGKLQRFTLICACAAIATGLGSAVLFQAIYNIDREGGFVIDTGTGATFYGGLIGGFTSFLILYFIVGYFFYKKDEDPKYHIKKFFSTISCAAPSIALAHGFGRLGCLTAGCCHGAQTDAWYGILMYGGEGYAKYVPTQLFEALFLFALFAFLFLNIKKGGKYNLSFYMGAYGIWRFVLEYVRNDYRGSVGISFLTPSQLISLVMIMGAAAIFTVETLVSRKLEEKEKSTAVEEASKDKEIN